MTPAQKLSHARRVVAEFIEPKPDLPNYYCHLLSSPKGFWLLVVNRRNIEWVARVDSLDRIRLIEERLTRKQRELYMQSLWKAGHPYAEDAEWMICHADADTRVLALAAALQITENPQSPDPGAQG